MCVTILIIRKIKILFNFRLNLHKIKSINQVLDSLEQPALKLFIYTQKKKPVRNSYVNNFDFDYHITLFQSLHRLHNRNHHICFQRKKKDNQKLAKILYHCGRLSFIYSGFSCRYTSIGCGRKKNFTFIFGIPK